MTIDANTTQIVIAIIGLFSLIVTGYVGIKQLQINKGQVAVAAEVAETKEAIAVIKTSIDGMQDKLLKAKDTAAVAQVEAAALAGEQRGREEGSTSAVVETVKGSNGELAALKKDIKTISEKLVEVSTPATPPLDYAALAKMVAAEMKKDQK